MRCRSPLIPSRDRSIPVTATTPEPTTRLPPDGSRWHVRRALWDECSYQTSECCCDTDTPRTEHLACPCGADHQQAGRSGARHLTRRRWCGANVTACSPTGTTHVRQIRCAPHDAAQLRRAFRYTRRIVPRCNAEQPCLCVSAPVGTTSDAAHAGRRRSRRAARARLPASLARSAPRNRQRDGATILEFDREVVRRHRCCASHDRISQCLVAHILRPLPCAHPAHCAPVRAPPPHTAMRR